MKTEDFGSLLGWPIRRGYYFSFLCRLALAHKHWVPFPFHLACWLCFGPSHERFIPFKLFGDLHSHFSHSPPCPITSFGSGCCVCSLFRLGPPYLSPWPFCVACLKTANLPVSGSTQTVLARWQDLKTQMTGSPDATRTRACLTWQSSTLQ